jgi:hypothetical protein
MLDTGGMTDDAAVRHVGQGLLDRSAARVRRARPRAAAGGVLTRMPPQPIKDMDMGLLDGLLGQVTENVDVKNLAEKVGLTPEQIESAVTALGQAHAAPGDTVATAAESTGLPSDTLQQIVAHIGGEGALGNFAALLGQQGGVLGQLGGLAEGFFGKK